MTLNQKTLLRFLDLAAKNLKGEWLLVGGTVLPILGSEHRSTVDIDFVGLGAKERQQQLEVFKIAEELGLPVDTINSAAALFVDRVLKNKNELVRLKKSKLATIYRPDTALFFKLKIARLSESDYSDCLAWLELFSKEINKKTKAGLIKLVKTELNKKNAPPTKMTHLNKLLVALKE